MSGAPPTGYRPPNTAQGRRATPAPYDSAQPKLSRKPDGSIDFTALPAGELLRLSTQYGGRPRLLHGRINGVIQNATVLDVPVTSEEEKKQVEAAKAEIRSSLVPDLSSVSEQPPGTSPVRALRPGFRTKLPLMSPGARQRVAQWWRAQGADLQTVVPSQLSFDGLVDPDTAATSLQPSSATSASTDPLIQKGDIRGSGSLTGRVDDEEAPLAHLAGGDSARGSATNREAFRSQLERTLGRAAATGMGVGGSPRAQAELGGSSSATGTAFSERKDGQGGDAKARSTVKSTPPVRPKGDAKRRPPSRPARRQAQDATASASGAPGKAPNALQLGKRPTRELPQTPTRTDGAPDAAAAKGAKDKEKVTTPPTSPVRDAPADVTAKRQQQQASQSSTARSEAAAAKPKEPKRGGAPSSSTPTGSAGNPDGVADKPTTPVEAGGTPASGSKAEKPKKKEGGTDPTTPERPANNYKVAWVLFALSLCAGTAGVAVYGPPPLPDFSKIRGWLQGATAA